MMLLYTDVFAIIRFSFARLMNNLKEKRIIGIGTGIKHLLFTEDIRSGRRSRHLSITPFWIFRKNKQLTTLLNIPAFVDSPQPSWTPRSLHKYNFYTCHDYVNLGGKKIYANMLHKLFFYTGFNASLHDFYVQFINNKIWVCVCKFYKKIFKVKRGRSVFFVPNGRFFVIKKL